MNQNLTGRRVFFRTLRIMIFRKRSYLQKRIMTTSPKKANTVCEGGKRKRERERIMKNLSINEVWTSIQYAAVMCGIKGCCLFIKK
jgi:hypothetical protein